MQILWLIRMRYGNHHHSGSAIYQHRDRAPPFQGHETLPLRCLQLDGASRCARERGTAAQAASLDGKLETDRRGMQGEMTGMV